MKRFLTLILFCLSALFLTNCSTPPNKVSSSSEKIHPHTGLRKLEIDTIKVGDSLIKAEAVLGKSTEKSSDPAGTTLTWWFAEDKDIEEQYYTFKTKPEDTTGLKFLKLIADPKGKITAKDFQL